MRYLAIALALICVLAIIVKHWSYIIKKSMAYEIYLDKQKACVGENVRMFTEITNSKVIPIPWIKVEIDIPVHFRFNNSKVEVGNEQKNLFKIITSLLGFQKLERCDSFKCNKRGIYAIKSAKVDIGDFLGLQKTTVGIKVKNELIVYPKIKDIIELIDISKTSQGAVSVRRWIINDPTQVIGVRKYTNEDSFNTIDWKSSAKNGELYVKKFDFTADPSIMMILDIQTEPISWMGSNCDFVEKGVDIIAAIMDKALNEKIPVGYSTNTVWSSEESDIFIYPSSVSKQKSIILEALAKTTYTKRYNIRVLMNDVINKLNKECTIIMLLSFISKELIRNLNDYVKNGYNIKIILLNNSCNIKGLNKSIEIIYSIDKGNVVSIDEEEVVSNVQ